MIARQPGAPSRWLLWMALVFILCAFAPALSRPGVLRAPLPKLSDGTTATHPWHVFWRDEVRAGRAPLWNPYVFAGMPAYGEPQMQTFYPGNVLWLVAPADLALKLSLLLHLLLGAWCTYRLTRELGATRAGGALGALIFGLHSQIIVFAFGGWTQVLAPMAWAPGILWQLARAHAGSTTHPWRAVALAGLGLGIQIISGHPEWVRYTLIAGGLLTLVGRGTAVPWRSRITRAVVALVIGVLVGMPQLGPTAQAALRSSRGQAAMVGDFQGAGASLPPETLPTFIVPRLFGPWDLSVSTDGLAHKARQAPISFGESLVYVGILPLLLAAVGVGAIRTSSDRSPLAVLVIGVTGLVFAFNDVTHAQDLLAWVVPADAVFRSPARFTFLVNLALIVLAALGWSRLERAAAGAGRGLVAITWGLAAVLAVGATVAWLSRDAVSTWLASHLTVPSTLAQRPALADGGAVFLRWAVSAASMETAVAAALTVGAALVLRRLATGAVSPGLPAVVLVLVAVDLGLFARPFLTSVVPLDDVYRDDLAVLSGVAPVAGARYLQTAPDLLPSGENTAILARTRAVGGYDLFVLDEWTRLSRSLTAAGDDTLAAAGVTHRLWKPDAGVPGFVDVADARGRAWWASRAIVARDANEAAARLAGATQARVVAIEPAAAVTQPPASADEPGSETQIEIVRDDPGRFAARVTAPKAGWLVFTEVFYPGWRGAIDGSPIEVSRAFGIFQTVPVPAGAHLVEISHQPRLWPFLVSAVLGLSLAAGVARRRR